MIHPSDVPLLEAFIKRELKDYMWREDGTELIRQSIIMAMWRDAILSCELSGREVYIESLTNMGQVHKVLRLPHKKWDNSAPDIYVNFGNSPKGRVSIYPKQR
ncbi:MAG: hypothetical protein Unbinned2691contig1000_54 [Prokaryotic dsDNA virus sp.]|nr:MAG: hypothetical protein Unbinned2691contig1000_54 [Prokaryotic dsDNA virus sp.]